MKFKKIFFIAFSFLWITSLFTYSHDVHAQRTCATMDIHDRLLETDPAYRKNRQVIEDFTITYVNRGELRTGIATIPVVVHVVYNTPAQNISNAQIASQIKILNEDFRKLNSDVSNVPSVFQSFAVDAKIQFALACRDPNGNPTTGITRTSTSVTSFSDNDAIKYTASGGRDAWPRDKYLNIWVGNLSGGYLGYAQFPGGPAATDGVVITYTAFGNTGTAASPFDKGRTASHEIGHWLNLRHIWGDDGDACTGSDLVSDTPNQAGPNYGTPTFPHVTCNNGPNGDMFMNYMDYVDDAAMFMFTTGQSTRMDAVLDGSRVSLLTSDGLSCSTANVSLIFLPLLLNEVSSSSCLPIPNGDFENGAVSWTEYSLLGFDLIGQWGVAHGGTWYTWLGGADNEDAAIQQQVTVPSMCPYLVFYHWIGSTDSCGYDYGYVRINGINAIPAIQLCDDENTGGWVRKSINLSSYANQTVIIKFQAVTDSSLNSNWFIDDVSFQQ